MIKYAPFQSNADYFFGSLPFIVEGQVVSTDDPDQMGRVRVWIPSIDGDTFDPSVLPWAEYASPFFGFTIDYPAGGIPTKSPGHAAYGFWAIPKIGATVLVFFLNGNPQRRFYFASTLRLHRNRSLPAGRNKDFNGAIGPRGDAGDGNGNLNPLEPAFSNLREQFQGKLTTSQAQTRGVFERQVAQAGNNKDATDGYAKSPIPGVSALDPQTYCWVTPGHHAIIMQDNPEQARLRIKTAEGHQIIFDDANERIYVSTAKGKTWVELDQDGHVHVFGAESISVRAGEDVNIYADRDVNVEAGRSINVKALGGDIRLDTAESFQLRAVKNIVETACGELDMTAEKNMKLTAFQNCDVLARGSIFTTAAGDYNVLVGGHLKQTASRIDLNGPPAKVATMATCAEKAKEPPIVPGHEPWKRPASKMKRGPNWKE